MNSNTKVLVVSIPKCSGFRLENGFWMGEKKNLLTGKMLIYGSVGCLSQAYSRF
jgi:hypothetical protein